MGVLFNGGQKAVQSKTLLILDDTSGIFLHWEWRATSMERKSPKDIQEPNKPSLPEPTKFPGFEGAFFST